MDSNQLEPWQLDRLIKQIAPTVCYLYKLRCRMEQKRFPRNDPVYLDVVAAHDKLKDLAMRLHYLACDRARERRR